MPILPYTCISKNNLLCLSFALLLPLAALSQDLKFVEKDGAITLYDGHSPRFSYQKETRSLNGLYPRANYVHPLYGLNEEILTEDFPEDHLHHRGIFWTWHQLYVYNKRVADPWFCEGIEWKTDSVITYTRGNSATMESLVYWRTPQNTGPDSWPDTVLQELVKIRYSQKNARYYELDFDITLIPLVEEVKIGGSEDIKGYGGFSVRLKAPDELSFYGKEGVVVPEETPVEAGGWVDVKGSFTSEDANQSGVIMMARPDELKSFQGWILRKKESMQNPAFPGREPLLLSKEKPLRFKNKLIVYKKSLSTAEIEKLYAAFLNE